MENISQTNNSLENEPKDEIIRTNDALNDFVQPTKLIERSPIDRNIINTYEKFGKFLRYSDFTGVFIFSPIQPYRQPYMGPVNVDVELDDEISFPTSLRVLVFPRNSTNSFPASTMNDDGVQSTRAKNVLLKLFSFLIVLRLLSSRRLYNIFRSRFKYKNK